MFAVGTTNPRNAALFWGTALLLVMAAGCGPKRVINTTPDPVEQASSPASPDQKPRIDVQLGESIPSRSVVDLEIQPPSDEPRTPAVFDPALGLRAADLAKEQVGKRFQWGGAGPDRFDCSGLVHYVYRNLGVDLPRVSADQARAGMSITREDMQPGDLLFFALTGQAIDHVAIYLGHGDFVHASRHHMPVRTASLDNAYWNRRLKDVRRVP